MSSEIPQEMITQIDCVFRDEDHLEEQRKRTIFDKMITWGREGVQVKIVDSHIVRISSLNAKKSVLRVLGWKVVGEIFCHDALEDPDSIVFS